MITIQNMTNLEAYGIACLTGEACGYGYRFLCDLNDAGIRLIADSMGMDVERLRDCLPANWNSRVNGAEAVRSIMLAPQMLTPLAVFACWRRNCSTAYIMYDGSVVGIEASDTPESVQMWLSWHQGKYCEECRRYGAGGGVNFQYKNKGFGRHQHQMSGRTE